MWWAWVWIAGCTAPDPQWWTIRIDGELIGRERWTQHAGETERWTQLSDVEWVERWAEDEAGHVIWRERDGRRQPVSEGVRWERAWVDCAPSQRVSEGGESRVVTCRSEGDLRHWKSEQTEGEVRLSGGAVVWTRTDGVERERVDVEPPRESLQGWSLPAGLWPMARAARTGEFVAADLPETPFQKAVDGVWVVSHPLDLEVSHGDRAKIQGWVKDLGEGDCQALAARVAARAQDDGVNAKVRTGLALVGDAFVPHAWVWVELGGKWVPVDPGLNRGIADAARVDIGERSPSDSLVALRRLRREGVTVRELR